MLFEPRLLGGYWDIRTAPSPPYPHNMPSGPSSPDRGELPCLASQLTEYLNSWDPIGLYRGDDVPPPGEYDCLTWPLLGRLSAGADVKVLTAFLDRELVEHFGLEAGSEGLATQLKCWWDQRR